MGGGGSSNKALRELKNILFTRPLLQYLDLRKHFFITTDSSGYAVGAVLSQGIVGKDLPVNYALRTLLDAELNYTKTEKELLVMA